MKHLYLLMLKVVFVYVTFKAWIYANMKTRDGFRKGD